MPKFEIEATLRTRVESPAIAVYPSAKRIFHANFECNWAK